MKLLMKQWVIGIVLCAPFLVPPPARAQASSEPATAQQPTGGEEQKPPAAIGEQGEKETRNFFSALVHNLGDDLKHMPRRNSYYWLAAGGVGALAIHPADDDINAHLEGSSDAFWKAGHIIGSTYVILPAAFGTYLIGRHTGSPKAQHLGMDEIEATILSEAFAEGLKIAVRRERPPETDGTQSNTFSFPSGHATLTFAAATVLQQHLGYKAGIPTYTVATYVAMSRLHDNRHWASDVVFGAALGIVIGRSVTWHGRNFYASPMLLRDGAGIQVALLH